jgi:hypothetical protein
MAIRWRVGDRVKPRREWCDDPNQIPTGIIVEIAPWGTCGAIYVAGERRAFASYVFEHNDQE